ncbi:MAG TPA: ABC transporter substrate-binding protein [Candidatus Tectomicrobia bacterium]|nr:ABC transporter substrate-binding protein [Candidatus Tectomicrobia bacterium]
MIPAALALIVAVTFGILLAPLDADGQRPGTLPKIGVLGIPLPGDATYRALLQGLHELGYIDGQNIFIEFRWGEPQRLPEFASELVRLHADVIATFGTPAALAAKHATTTIPIVMAMVGDPVRTGIVASLAQPGGNVTGVTNLAPAMVPKRLELLKEAVPHASRVALLWNPANQDQLAHFHEAEAGAWALGLTLQSVAVRSGEELEPALAAMMRERPSVLLMTGDTIIQGHIDRILAFAVEHRLPVVHQLRENAEAGELMSYGTSRPHLIRRAAVYIDKILKGAKPANLPLEQPMKFELVINLRTA